MGIKKIGMDVLIVTLCIILSMGLHIITSAFSTVPADVEINLGKLTLWYIAAFGGISIIYRMHQKSSSTCGLKSGVAYGAGIGILWLWGMVEGVALIGNSFINELVTGTCDAVPVFIMGILLSLNRGEGEEVKLPHKGCVGNLKNNMVLLGTFISIFTIMRYISYFTGIIDSGYEKEPLVTLIWTLVMGGVIALSFMIMGMDNANSSRREIIMKYAVMVFGVNWFLFNLFIPVIFQGTLLQVVIRSLVDTSAVIVSISFYLSLRSEMDKHHKHKLQK